MNKVERIETPKRYAAPAVEKTLDILEYLSAEPQPRTRTEIARALGRGPSELFRMLACLEERGYVRRDPVTATYSLTLRLFELGHMHSPHETLIRVGGPPMQTLVMETGESCHLSVLHGGRLVVLLQEESRKPFRLSVEVGTVHPPHRTTSGRLILAHMDEAERESILELYPDYRALGPAERTAFAAHLKAIREAGYHLKEGEYLRGEVVLGVAIGDPHGRVKAAIVIPTLTGFDPSPILDMLPALRRCAAEIAQKAGLADLPEPRWENRT